MRRRAALLALVLAALAAASCSRRDRLNPLDGLNPRTGGAPEGFNAIADFGAVRLVWTPRPELAIDGFMLLRLAPGDSLFRPLGPLLPRTANSFLDSPLPNGGDVRYRLYFVVNGVLAARFAEDVATPGSVLPWVVDASGGRLLRLAPDGRDVLLARGGFGQPFGLAVTQGLGPVWVADHLNTEVRVIDPHTFNGSRIQGIPSPFTIALDPFDGSGWINDLQGSVRHYNADGTPANPNGLSVIIQDPTGIATNPATGDLWVAENDGSRIRRFSRSGAPLGAYPLSLPSRVAVDSTTGIAWVTSAAAGKVWRISPAVAPLDSTLMSAPLGVALDYRRRIAWIADPNANALVAFDMDTRAERFRIDGLDGALGVDVDLSRGDAWVVARGAGSVTRVSATGVVLGRVAGLGDPYDVRVDYSFQ